MRKTIKKNYLWGVYKVGLRMEEIEDYGVVVLFDMKSANDVVYEDFKFIKGDDFGNEEELENLLALFDYELSDEILIELSNNAIIRKEISRALNRVLKKVL